MKDDFPTLGLPIIANFGISNSSVADSSLKLRINSSNNSPVPLPLIDEIGKYSPIPRL